MESGEHVNTFSALGTRILPGGSSGVWPIRTSGGTCFAFNSGTAPCFVWPPRVLLALFERRNRPVTAQPRVNVQFVKLKEKRAKGGLRNEGETNGGPESRAPPACG